MLDLVGRNVVLPDGRDGMTIGCENGRIVALARDIVAEARQIIDARGCLVSSPFVDAHFHTIRSHVDVCDPSLRAAKALLEVRELVKGEIDLLRSHPAPGPPIAQRVAQSAPHVTGRAEPMQQQQHRLAFAALLGAQPRIHSRD